MKYMDELKESYKYIKEHTAYEPKVGLILGSGLGEIADEFEQSDFIDYKDIPHFPVSHVEGHKNRLVFGKLFDRQIVAMQGRIHYYEGFPLKDIVFPVRLMKLIGINTLIVTNAAGSVNESFNPGDLMLITDHLNLLGNNPLVGDNLDELGPRFPDMTYAYSPKLQGLARQIAARDNISLKEGVYAASIGPSYETKAEVKMVRTLGADAVGMSTVPEVITANHMGVDVLGISCITNMAAGILDQPLSHAEVIEVTERAKGKFKKLVKNVVKEI